MKKAVAFCGYICSGKTTLTDYFCDKYKWDKISFGKYIKSLSKNQLSQNRKTWQDIGYKIFKNTTPNDFLIQVIKFNESKSKIHVYDSIRHLDILFEVRKYYDETIVFYLKTNEIDLYERYIKKYDDGITYSQFEKMNRHPIEKEISDIIHHSDYILDGSKPKDDLILEVNLILEKLNYFNQGIKKKSSDGRLIVSEHE